MSADEFSRNAAADGRSVLRMERRYPHPVAKVWSAVTDPEQLAAWFPSRVSVDLRVGGELRFTGDPNLPDTKGRVTDLDPPRVFAFTWEDDHLRFELTPDGDGTLFRLVHTFGDTFGAASFASGWDACLASLADGLDGRPAPVRRPSGEDHDRYLRQFGLDRGDVVPAAGDGDGVAVRFERQLAVPEADVRAALASWPAAASWELRAGTGHGPRLVVTVPAPASSAADVEAEWRARIDALPS